MSHLHLMHFFCLFIKVNSLFVGKLILKKRIKYEMYYYSFSCDFFFFSDKNRLLLTCYLINNSTVV